MNKKAVPFSAFQESGNGLATLRSIMFYVSNIRPGSASFHTVHNVRDECEARKRLAEWIQTKENLSQSDAQLKASRYQVLPIGPRIFKENKK